MKFIRDIIFEKRAARPTEPARWVEEFAEDAGADLPTDAETPAVAGMEAETAGLASVEAEAEFEVEAEVEAPAEVEVEDDFSIEAFARRHEPDPPAATDFSAPLILRRPVDPAPAVVAEPEVAAEDEVAAEVEAEAEAADADDLRLDFESSIAAFEVETAKAVEDLVEDIPEEPFVNPQQSFYDRLKRLEAQRDDRQPPMGVLKAAARAPEPAAPAAPFVAPKPVAASVPPRPAAPAESAARPAEPVARPRTLEEMPFVRAPQPRPAPAVAAAASPVQRPLPAASDGRMPAAMRPAGEAAPAATFQVPPPAAGRGSDRSERVKTRLLGFNPDQIGLSDPFEKPVDKTRPSFPVGWLVVVAGPGRGAAFALQDGVSRIGRGEDQTVSLNFGDNSISRENHVAVAFDAEQGAFFIGQSGRANIVRLNNKPLLSTEQMRTGDQVRVGETTLRFVALCGDGFTWAEPAGNDARHA